MSARKQRSVYVATRTSVCARGGGAGGGAGFAMIELLAVMTIVGILIALAIPTYNVNRDRAKLKATAQAATDYARAINATMARNGNFPPVVGSADWPNLIAGPVDPATGKSFLHAGTPEVFEGDQPAQLVAGGGPVPGEPTIVYTPGPAPPQWVLTVHDRAGVVHCWIARGATGPAGAPQC